MAGFVGGKQLEYCFAEGFAYGDYEPSTAKERILLNPRHLEMQQVRILSDDSFIFNTRLL